LHGFNGNNHLRQMRDFFNQKRMWQLGLVDDFYTRLIAGKIRPNCSKMLMID
jgi:hypothetical protein